MSLGWMTKQLNHLSDTPMLLMVLLCLMCRWWMWVCESTMDLKLTLFMHRSFYYCYDSLPCLLIMHSNDVVLRFDDDDDEPVLHLLTDANSPHKDRLADRHLKPTPNIQKRCHLANEKDTENNRACVTLFSVIQCNTYWVQPQLSIAASFVSTRPMDVLVAKRKKGTDSAVSGRLLLQPSYIKCR